MRVLTWNTWAARGTSVALSMADRVDAAVVLLQEASRPLLWTGPWVGATVPNRSWGSWIMVRSGTLTKLDVAHHAGWVAGAEWHLEGDDAPTYLFSVHSPTSNISERRNSYIEESMAIVSAICEQVPPDARLVIGGDFNFKSFGERLASEQIQNNDAELRALKDFRRRGLTIAWRDLHPEQALPQTLRWLRDRTKPFHCDGFLTRGYTNAAMSCDILCSEPDASISDHNPMVLQVC